ncbi:hypothetical protein X777_15540 [Ooceraea biroi]|uniref:GIY-YIG domain-containing protein n=1 Tax=Ooceraea biroi TaxID=2015173 RepID=A0A026X3U2_OOCBI|nr:hypothetical protein X777_15540 [Ooceraea biroi]
MAHCNVVYKISCNDCDASYVGRTKQQLHTRINEHRKDINKRTGSPSVISSHKLESSHDFKWDDIEILDEKRSCKKRLISEMVNIKRQVYPLNLQKDTESLPEDYLPILNLFLHNNLGYFWSCLCMRSRQQHELSVHSLCIRVVTVRGL